jgi:hypothetical protein
MRLRQPNFVSSNRITSLSLDDGADAHECFENPVEISERGMQIRSRWQFEIGTQLSVSFVRQGVVQGQRRLVADGIVVWCEPCQASPGLYQSTLLFLEVPDELRDSLQALSDTLDGAWE